MQFDIYFLSECFYSKRFDADNCREFSSEPNLSSETKKFKKNLKKKSVVGAKFLMLLTFSNS